MVRTISRSVACLLLASSAIVLAASASAQSTQNQPAAGAQQPQQPSGGLILPGTVQPGQSGAAAGRIQPQPPQPQAQPQAQPPRPAAAPAGQAQPTQQRPQQAAPAQQGGQQQGRPQQQAAPAQPGRTAQPAGDWQIGPEVFSDGSFRICVAEARFDNNLVLGLLRNPAKRVNMIIGVPGGNMPPGARFEARVKIDNRLDKTVPAIITNPEILTVNIAADESIPAAIAAGNTLTVEVPGEALAFQLRGTSKALNDLSTCVDQALAGTLELPAPPPMMPPQLAQLLVDSGLKDAQALPVDKMPAERRPGEFAWRIGEAVLGAVERFPVDPKTEGVAKIGGDYMEALKQACPGTFTPTNGSVEKLPNGEMMSGTATCQGQEGTFYLSVAFQLVNPPPGAPDGLPKQFNVFTHRGPTEAKGTMDGATTGIMKALKQRASNPPAAAAQGQAAPQAQPQGQR